MRSFVSLGRIALRNVLRNRRRTLITLSALLIGVGVMVSVRGVLNGLQVGLVENVVNGQTGALQVHKKDYLKNVLASPLTLDMDAKLVAERIGKVAGVKAIAPRINFGGMVNVGEETLFLMVQAVDPKAELAVCPLRGQNINDGGKFTGSVAGVAPVADAMVLTVELQTALGNQQAAGQPAKDTEAGNQPAVQAALLAPDKDGALSGENVTLTGTLQLNSPGERKVGLARIDVAQRLLKMEGRVTEYVVAVDDLSEIPAVKARLEEALGPEYEVHSWEDIAKFVVDVRARQNVILQVIASIFMLLMLLGVANTMLMSVLDRTREIGTMLALGVRRGRIVALFLMEATLIGALGGVVGGVAGKALTTVLNVVGITVKVPSASVPFTIRPFVGIDYLLLVVAIAGAGALVFSLYPAWRASRLRPVQALAGG